MERAARRAGLPPELAVAALVGAATLPLGRLFRPGPLPAVALAAIAAGVTVAWLLERLRAPMVLSALASVAAFTWLASALFVPDTLLGPFPSIRSLEALGEMFRVALRIASVDVAPVEPKPELLLLGAVGVWATAWLVHDAAIRLRYPLLAIALALPLALFPGTILAPGAGRRWAEAGALLAASLVLLFKDQRVSLFAWGPRAGRGRPGWSAGRAFRLGALICGAAVGLAPLVPGYGGTPLLQELHGRGPSVVYNPIVSIRPTLRHDPVRELLRVTTPVPVYLRLTSLDRFDGKIWTVKAEPWQALDAGSQLAVPAGAPTASVSQDITIVDLGGTWLPAAYLAVDVAGAGRVAVDPASQSLSTRHGLRAGMRYQVTSVVPRPSRGRLDRTVAYDDPGLRRYLELPRSLPREVRTLAARIAGAEPTPYRRALALQEHLRRFTYDEQVAAGHSFDDIVEFLTETRRGYCEQFAGSMAVLARSLGIPARVVVGFAVGRRVAPESDTYSITTRHAHAWVEVFFPGIGWVTFEPTPRGGVTRRPSYARPAAPAAPSPGAESPGASPGSSAAPVPGRRPAETDDRRAGDAGGLPATAYVGIALAALALSVPAGARARRALGRRRSGSPREAAALRYREFLDWCARTGLGRRLAETPHEHAERIALAAPGAERPLRELASVAAGTLWGPAHSEGDQEPDPVTAVERAAGEAKAALARTLPTARRWLDRAGWGYWRTDSDRARRAPKTLGAPRWAGPRWIGGER